MTPDSIIVGRIVVNEGQKEWGLGKVVHVDPVYLSVYFKNIEGAPKNAIKKFRRDQNRLALAETQTDIALDNLPPIVIHDGIADFRAPHRITEEQAIATFKRKYGNFRGSLYEEHEGSYKRATHEYISQNLLQGKGRAMLARGEYSELSTILRKITQQSGLLAVQERIALNDAFKDNDATARFAGAVLDFVENLDHFTFSSLVEATGSLPAASGKAKVLTWPIVTLFPFLARPMDAMFLKPEASKRLQESFSFDLQYSPEPNWITYSKLLQISQDLLAGLRPLGARDLIDVQSFIWIVFAEPYRTVDDPTVPN